MKPSDLTKWVLSYLTTDEIREIEAKIGQVERLTSAEIVPMIVRRSTPRAYSARLWFWFSFSMVSIVAFSLWTAVAERVTTSVFDSMSSYPTESLGWSIRLAIEFAVLGSTALLSYGLASIASQIPFIERLLIPSEVLRTEVLNRAEFEFSRSDLRSTAGGTGVLVFVSLFERQAVILADRAFAKIDGSTGSYQWNQESARAVDLVLEQMLRRLKAKEMKLAFVEAVENLGKHLAEIAPPRAANDDEISNKLRILS